MRGCLDRLAGIALAVPDGEQLPERLGRNLAWWQLRYEHAAALRRELQDRYLSAATVNKHLSALRQITRECWRLGLMSAEDASGSASWKASRAAGRR